MRAAAAKAIERLTTPYKEGYVPPGCVNWNDADDNNAFHSKLMVMDFDGTRLQKPDLPWRDRVPRCSGVPRGPPG